jgi:hypothetical protein
MNAEDRPDSRPQAQAVEAVATTPTNLWGVLSVLTAAATLPIWGFFVASSVAFKNPVDGTAVFNVLPTSFWHSVRGSSIETGLLVIAALLLPFITLLLAALFRPAHEHGERDRFLRYACWACVLIVVLGYVTVVPLFFV